MNFVSNRDIIVRSIKTGHAIEFLKGVPTLVPERMYEEVMEKGIIPVEGEQVKAEQAIDSASASKIVLPPDDQFERDKKILEVVKEIVKRNRPSDFAGGGHPAASSVSTGLGWKVDQKEVRLVWEKHRAEILNKKAA